MEEQYKKWREDEIEKMRQRVFWGMFEYSHAISKDEKIKSLTECANCVRLLMELEGNDETNPG